MSLYRQLENYLNSVESTSVATEAWKWTGLGIVIDSVERLVRGNDFRFVETLRIAAILYPVMCLVCMLLRKYARRYVGTASIP